MRSWSTVSLKNLRGVHSDLSKVMDRALQESPVDFRVIEGLRSMERQRQLVRAGASTTLRSRHLTGHAVDIAPVVDGKIRWDWPLFHRIAPIVKDVARSEGVDLEWGGDWKSFPDGPHWQLSWNSYP